MGSSEKKNVKIYGVPMDLGSNPLGVTMGPAAIRYAGLHNALEFNDIRYIDCGDLTIDSAACRNGSLDEIERVSEELAKLVADAVQNGYIPITIGGDHSVSIGSIAGVSMQSERLGLLWLDCHPDANTPETSPSGNVHGMTVAISLGYGFENLVNCAGFRPKIIPENVCIVGAKDIDRGEREFLHGLGVKLFTLYDIEKYGIVQIFDQAYEIVSRNTDRIHVSFDVDVLDPLIAPGTGILSRGGLSYREIIYVMETLGQRNCVSSIDIIEINPLLDIKNQTSELVVELLLAALGGAFGDYERNYLRHGV